MAENQHLAASVHAKEGVEIGNFLIISVPSNNYINVFITFVLIKQ